MVEDFTIETFAGRVGEPFRVQPDSGDALEAELVEATQLAPPREAGARAPFSLVFRGPAEPLLPQRIYTVEHDELGAFEIFVVPIGRDEAGTSYEAVFT